MGKPGKSYNDLEMVEGDIADDNSNEQSDKPLDPRAGNVNVEIPRIKFNAKDVAKLLNKYVTQVDCTKKCLIELTKLLKYYNRLGEGILPYKPKDLKVNSQVLKKKKNKNLSKMVKEGAKKLEMIDSKIKKNNRKVIDNYKNLKKLKNMGELIVDHGNIGKSIWKVKNIDECESKKNFSFNGSWAVSDDTISHEDSKKTVSVTDNDEPSLILPTGFKVEVSETSNDTLNTKVKTTPNLKSVINRSPKNSDSKKIKSSISKIADKSASKKANELAFTITPDNALKSVKNPNSTTKRTPNNEIEKIIHLQTKSPNTNVSNEPIILNKNDIQKIKSPSIIKCIANTSVNTSVNSSLLRSIDNDWSTSKSPESPPPKQRVLRQRTIVIQKKNLEDGTPKRKVKESSEPKTVQKRRKTIGLKEMSTISKPEETSMLKRGKISNRILEKVRSDAFEDVHVSPRRSARLSIKTDSAKKKDLNSVAK